MVADASFSPSIQALLNRYRAATADPVATLEAAFHRSNSNAGKNVYLVQDRAWSMQEADHLRPDHLRPDRLEAQPLWGIPVSLKDCFDLKGFITSCGSKSLRQQRTPATQDSAVASRLRTCGAVIVGKTHMHQLAYGITGENQDFGDCLQPGDPGRLTGGSSSGAAASILEGSALAAIGTDTGGSIRVPAALCGISGYRASITLGADLWAGGEHLATTFDTLGWLYRHAADGPLLCAALFGLPIVQAKVNGLRVGVPEASFMQDCEPQVLATLARWILTLQASGAIVERFDAGLWQDSMEIFAPIQASEAATLHPEPRDAFEPTIAARLRWGASLSPGDLKRLHERLEAFRRRSEQHLAAFDLLLVPNTPVAALRAGEDHSGARAVILRYTTPISLLGWPVVTLPGGAGAPQLIGKMGTDAQLLALSAELAGSPS